MLNHKQITKLWIYAKMVAVGKTKLFVANAAIKFFLDLSCNYDDVELVSANASSTISSHRSL